MRYLAPFGLEFFRLCVWFILLTATFVPLEKFFPLHPHKLFRKAFGTDVVYYFLTSLLPKLLLILPMTIVAAGLHRVTPGAFYSWVGSLPLAIRLAGALLVGEIGSYWAHRWSHQIPFLWRFHAVHHSAEEIDWLVNSRAHPVDIVFTRLCSVIPMYALGLAQPMANQVDMVPVLVTILGTIWGFFIHANVNWRLGWFEWLVASPAFHHWHHTNDSPDVIDKNYAAMLPWLDKCFGTFYLPKRWPARYGTDTPVARDLTGQLLNPLFEPAPVTARQLSDRRELPKKPRPLPCLYPPSASDE
ncbi:MAG TPA: sterol desaturase family protein [Bryobacteraceae bacterium]|nr:sterol desaturase family protein [Bryobacteraceae bacterium]